MMQRVLVFDCGKDQKYVGLWQPDQSPEWLTEPVESGAAKDNALIKALDNLLQRTSITLGDITHIGVMRGPSAYTQLRSFIATANSLAWASRIPLFAFGPDATLPDSLPDLLQNAHRDVPIEPCYPSSIE